jgi:hypothetical protein
MEKEKKNSKIGGTPENPVKEDIEENMGVVLKAFEKRKVFRFWAHMHDAGGALVHTVGEMGRDQEEIGIGFSLEISAADVPLLVCEGILYRLFVVGFLDGSPR